MQDKSRYQKQRKHLGRRVLACQDHVLMVLKKSVEVQAIVQEEISTLARKLVNGKSDKKKRKQPLRLKFLDAYQKIGECARQLVGNCTSCIIVISSCLASWLFSESVVLLRCSSLSLFFISIYGLKLVHRMQACLCVWGVQVCSGYRRMRLCFHVCLSKCLCTFLGVHEFHTLLLQSHGYSQTLGLPCMRERESQWVSEWALPRLGAAQRSRRGCWPHWGALCILACANPDSTESAREQLHPSAQQMEELESCVCARMGVCTCWYPSWEPHYLNPSIAT